MSNIKLSVIMPLFNVEKTLRLALDSIFMQHLNVEYEVIAIDDASTDNTLDILKDYKKNHKQLKIVHHKKNQGNAISFYDGLVISRGDYFCVLDGDDFYTVKTKLQTQIDFLDGDKRQEYIAVNHKYLTINSDFQILDEQQLYTKESDFSYLDYLKRIVPYEHTATYMYRNLFRGKVPEKFKQEMYRGDSPRTFMHLLYSKGKIKHLDFVGSVYYYNSLGIWSSKSSKEQNERNKHMIAEQLNALSSTTEKKIWTAPQTYLDLDENDATGLWKTADYFLNKLSGLACKYAFKHPDFTFLQLYKSEYIDSFCESLGFIELVKRGIIPSRPIKRNNDIVMIIISNLTATGGGIYNEIKDILNIYREKRVCILWTNVDGFDDLDLQVREQLLKFKNVDFLYGSLNTDNKLSKLFDCILSVKPVKIYNYCGHNDVWANSLNQSMLSYNICVFSFDHGFVLGLDNTNYDRYITKRATDYQLLSKKYGKKVIYVPCFNKDKVGANKYQAFYKHDKLITASAAARYYKITGTENDYIGLIIDVLQKNGGKHIHYGPIPKNELKKIYKKLDEVGIAQDRFIIIRWADDLVQSMYDNHVDLFIEPFSIVSYKITLDVLSAGIPVIIHDSNVRMGITDFIYPGCLRWKNPDDFLDILSTLDYETLRLHSVKSREYYLKNHTPDVVADSFKKENNFNIPQSIKFFDDAIIDMRMVSDIIDVNIKNYERPRCRVLGNMRLKQRIKLLGYLFVLLLVQIPILDLLCSSRKRRKLLKKIIKNFR